jgi:hypothetical protein
MDIRMIKTLRRLRTPTTPMVNSAALNSTYQDKGTMEPPRISALDY